MRCERDIIIFHDKSINEIDEVFKNIKLEFGSKPAQSITDSRTTFLMCAAIQQLEECWLNNKTPPSSPYLTFQPVIRTQYSGNVDEERGIFTSFINAAVIGPAGANNENFYLLLKIWKEKLEQIYGNNLIISQPISSQGEWGKARFTDITIKFYGKEGNLELGDAVLKQFESGLRIVDCGFGLERLCLALGIFPWRNSQSEILDFEIIDYLRTLTLLCGSGVKPSQKGQGYRTRLFANLLIGRLRNLNNRTLNLSVIRELIKFYYDYFKQFNYPFVVDEDRVFKEIINELRRSSLSKIFLKTFGPDTKLLRIMGTFNFYCSNLDEFLSQFDKDNRARIMETVKRDEGLFSILF